MDKDMIFLFKILIDVFMKLFWKVVGGKIVDRFKIFELVLEFEFIVEEDLLLLFFVFELFLFLKEEKKCVKVVKKKVEEEVELLSVFFKKS